MSRFFSNELAALSPYTPGEQPQEKKYLKLNTNESPYAPPEEAFKIAHENLRSLNLYSDPACGLLKNKLAEIYDVPAERIVLSNGSDELLFFAFRAFCDSSTPALFPDISYGFYPVFAAVNKAPYEEIPLRDDFSINIGNYKEKKGTIIIANPNAPTGMTLTVSDIEELLNEHPDNVIVVDEAYVDFGADSCVRLTDKYENLIVTQTFSKSRSFAGGRLGFAITSRELALDLEAVRFSVNPYNINSMTMALGYGILCCEDEIKKNCVNIARAREYTVKRLKEYGFDVLPSKANFIFAKNYALSGGELYEKLKKNGVLVRHFEKDRIKDFVRISIGTQAQMEMFFEVLLKMM